MIKSFAIAGAFAAALVLAPTGASAFDETAIGDISGAWSGKGFVRKDEKADPMNVRCAIEGTGSALELAFAGECRAMLILKREIGATLRREGHRLVGIYKGARVGDAALDGEIAPSGEVVLSMQFPRKVNGDDVATMRIEAHDADSFTIVTSDRMVSGDEVTTSRITFERKRSRVSEAAQ